MAKEIITAGPTGLTLYARIFDPLTGKVWNTVTELFETYVTANILNYGTLLAELGTASGIYEVDFPVTISYGAYDIFVYQRVGGSFAESDPLISNGTIQRGSMIGVLSLSDIWEKAEATRGLIDTEVADIKAKTDQLTFTASGYLDANVLRIGGQVTTAGAAVAVGPFVGQTTSVLAANASGHVILQDASLVTAKLGTFILAKTTNITGFNDIAATSIVSAGAITTLAGAVVNVDLVDTLTTYTGNTVQTGDSFGIVNSGTHGNAAIKGYVDDIGAAGAGLSAIPWNPAWDTEVQSEVADALTAYDPPTNTEMEARTLVAAGYATATSLATVDDLVDDLETRLTAARAGYLDNLNVGGNVASSAEVTSIQNNTRVVRVVPVMIERPDAGTTTYRIELLLYDAVGNMEAPDSAPTIALVDQDGTDLSSRLDSATMALVSTGRYRAVYTATSTDDLEQLVWTFSVVEGGATRVYGNTSLIVDTTAVDFTTADRTKLEAIHMKLPSKSFLTGSSNSDGDVQLNEATGALAADVITTGAFAAGTTVPRVTLVDTLTTYTGNTPQTGDSFSIVNSGTHGNAAIKGYVDDIGVAGLGLSAIPWNAAWDAEVQREVADALAVYDPPTSAELDARTLVAASYATAAALATVNGLVDDLEGRLTATRAGYLDNLSAGAVATAAQISALNDLSSADVVAAVGIAGSDLDAQLTAILAAVEAVPLDTWTGLTVDTLVDGVSPGGALRIIAAVLAGELSGADGSVSDNSIVISAIDGSKTRVTSQADLYGNRSDLVLDAD